MSVSFDVYVYEVPSSAPDWRASKLPVPMLVEQFSVQGTSQDQSKDLVRARLQSSGRKIRSMSWAPCVGTETGLQIITYVYPQESL